MSTTNGTQSGEVIARVIAALSELESDERARALRAIVTFFDHDQVSQHQPRSALPSQSHQDAPFVSAFSGDRRPSPKAFLHEKQPATDVERMACLAYYLAHYRELPQFKTDELTKLNTEAAQAKFSNASFASANALKMGYLAPADKGRRQLSAAGERFVEALPDREAARHIMSATRAVGRRRRARERANGKK